MIRKEASGIAWLEFSLLQGEKIRHAIFLKQGGVSQGCFASLNLSMDGGDLPEHVVENRSRVQKVFSCEQLIMGRQNHGAHVALAEESPHCKECDALLSNKVGQALTILHADCQAAIFYDPIRHVLANVHCGWRGNVQNIYQKVVSFLQQMGSYPENILVGISPSLGPKWAEFIHYKEEFPGHFHCFRKENDRFDLWEISRMQLEGAGVLSHHIECANICTYEQADQYFSYRREKKTGRHATIASLLSTTPP